LLFAVIWCDASGSQPHLSTGLMLFSITAESSEPLVLSLKMCRCHLPLLIYSCQFSFSDNSFSDDRISTVETAFVFFIVFSLLLLPSCLSRRCF
jgi:hypothetical protein